MKTPGLLWTLRQKFLATCVLAVTSSSVISVAVFSVTYKSGHKSETIIIDDLGVYPYDFGARHTVRP